MEVFISYQRTDTLFPAHAVYYALQGAGHRAFIDTGSIGGGELYLKEIKNRISNANVMLALIGPTFDFARLHQPTSVVAYEWRLARFHGIAVVPVLIGEGLIPSDDKLPPEFRWFTKRDAFSLRRESFADDISELINEIPALSTIPRRAARVLWVDNNPANNEYEREILRPYGIVFDNVVSTFEAVEQIKMESYDLVITDLSRILSTDNSQSAAVILLNNQYVKDAGPPVLVYTDEWGVKQKDELLQHGAAEVTSDFHQFKNSVLKFLCCLQDQPDSLSR